MHLYKTGLAIGLAALALSTTAPVLASGYSEHPQAKKLIAELAAEPEFNQQSLQQLFSQAEKKQSILDAISRPAEKSIPWFKYRKIFLGKKRIDKGVEFWQENQVALAKASQQYGVPEEIIVAIIGVETHYGRITGSYRVIDALSTLAFDYPRRSPFFTKELKHFLHLAKEQGQDPLSLKGSYAGAMGYGQFMPSSYRHYAVDFDGDQLADIWNNPTDAIGSVANYFKRHGWQTGQPVVETARLNKVYQTELANKSLKPKYTVASLAKAGFRPAVKLVAESPASLVKLEAKKGDKYWIGLHNFYVITRYNHSRMYAMAVYQLSQEIGRKHQAAQVLNSKATNPKVKNKSTGTEPKA